MEKVGDQHPLGLFQAVGEALTAWEKLEAAQGHLFSTLVSSRAGAALAAYGAITSSSERGVMILAAARSVFSPAPVLEEIQNLIRHIGNLAARRNDIAHGAVTEFHAEGVTEHEPTRSLGYYLAPNGYVTRKRGTPVDALTAADPSFEHTPALFGTYAYTAVQVGMYAQHFRSHEARAYDVTKRIEAYCAQRWPGLPASDEN